MNQRARALKISRASRCFGVLHAVGLNSDQIARVEPLPQTAAFIET